MMHPDLHTLTGAYAVDALDDDERDAFEAHLPDCDACAEEVAGFLATTSLLAASVAEAPPAGMRSNVLDRISTTRQDAPTAPAPRRTTVTPLRTATGRPARRAWLDRLVLPAAAVMAVVVAGMAIMLGSVNNRLDEMAAASADVTAVMAAGDLQTWEAEMDGGTARVVYSATRGEGLFLADGMAAAGDDLAYELWLIDDEGTPVPAGLFDATDRVAAHRFTGALGDTQAIGVTVEPASGSPQPTSDPVVVVEL